DALLENDYKEQFPVDAFHGGGGIGINMNVNEVIAALAGHEVQPVDDVNMSQSTSDVCHTALRLCLYKEVGRLIERVKDLICTVMAKAESFREYLTIASTSWQDGMSVSASAELEGFAGALSEQLAWTEQYRNTLLKVNLGWTVIGSGKGAADEYRLHIMNALGEVTGLPFEWKNSVYQAAQYTEDLSVLSAYIRTISSVTAKFARDVRILSSGPETGLGEWSVPAVQAGSSFFPGKVNPVMAEMIIQCDMLVGGNDSVIQNILSQGEIHLNVWEEMAGFLLIQNITRLSKATELFYKHCVSGIELNKETSLYYSRASIPLITDYKEKYGYKKLAVQVKKYGFENVVERIRKGELDR
ncbi:MAG: hypothetical protein K2N63_15850, partial [Lachnospiraceae bacterium]|nr:hypothetical protein [Lachnospiraceae bacterium]